MAAAPGGLVRARETPGPLPPRKRRCEGSDEEDPSLLLSPPVLADTGMVTGLGFYPDLSGDHEPRMARVDRDTAMLDGQGNGRIPDPMDEWVEDHRVLLAARGGGALLGEAPGGVPLTDDFGLPLIVPWQLRARTGRVGRGPGDLAPVDRATSHELPALDVPAKITGWKRNLLDMSGGGPHPGHTLPVASVGREQGNGPLDPNGAPELLGHGVHTLRTLDAVQKISEGGRAHARALEPLETHIHAQATRNGPTALTCVPHGALGTHGRPGSSGAKPLTLDDVQPTREGGRAHARTLEPLETHSVQSNGTGSTVLPPVPHGAGDTDERRGPSGALLQTLDAVQQIREGGRAHARTLEPRETHIHDQANRNGPTALPCALYGALGT